jgi:hypothetical protein
MKNNISNSISYIFQAAFDSAGNHRYDDQIPARFHKDGISNHQNSSSLQIKVFPIIFISTGITYSSFKQYLKYAIKQSKTLNNLPSIQKLFSFHSKIK